MNPFEYGGVRVLSSAGWTTRMRRPSSCAGRRSKLARKRRSCSRGMCSATCDLVRSRAISCDLVRSRAISCDLVRSRVISCDLAPRGRPPSLQGRAAASWSGLRRQPAYGDPHPQQSPSRSGRPPPPVQDPTRLRSAFPLPCATLLDCAAACECAAFLPLTPLLPREPPEGERGADAELTLSRSALPETGP